MTVGELKREALARKQRHEPVRKLHTVAKSGKTSSPILIGLEHTA